MVRKVYTIYSADGIPEILNRLSIYCDTQQPIGFYEYRPEIIFVGVIDDNSFVITPINFRRNAALPKIIGRLCTKGKGREIVLKTRPDSYLPFIVITVAAVAANVLQIAEHSFNFFTLAVTILEPV